MWVIWQQQQEVVLVHLLQHTDIDMAVQDQILIQLKNGVSQQTQNAADVGDLLSTKEWTAGTQY